MVHRVCVFEGDDASPEAVRPTVELLRTLDASLEFERPSVADHRDELEEWRVPPTLREAIASADSILFGAGGSIHRPILYYLRHQFGGGLFANVRPIRYVPGARSPLAHPEGIDYTIVRENLQGAYFAAEGRIEELRSAMPELTGSRHGTSVSDLDDGAFGVRVFTEPHLRRVARFGFEFAVENADGDSVRLTCATKSNVLTETDGLFERVVEETARDYPSVTYEHLHADDVAQRLVTNPQRFDVVVTPNFAGDLLSDLGAGTVGGLGMAPSACYGEDRAYFEPVHGSAPDIAGENVINPTATMLSAAMLLDHLGEDDAARRLRRAVEGAYADGDRLTPDQGGTASTTEFAEAVEERL